MRVEAGVEPRLGTVTAQPPRSDEKFAGSARPAAAASSRLSNDSLGKLPTTERERQHDHRYGPKDHDARDRNEQKGLAITIATTKTRAASDPRMTSVDGPTLREGRVVPSLTWAISGWMA